MLQSAPAIKPILDVRDLVVDFPGKKINSRIISGLSLSLESGETLGIVGESGSGKSLLARTLVRLESPAKIISGSVVLDGQDLVAQHRREMKGLRGKKISLVLQNPKGSMDPVFTMGSQFREILALSSDPNQKGSVNRETKDKKIYQLLKDVNIASPEERCRQYPHQWSRGMLQRAQLQMAFSTGPEVVILDEITSALDPAITIQILRLMSEYKKKHGTAIIFITHDLSVAGEICDRIAVMQRGTIVEQGNAKQIIESPSHSYTQRLVSGMSGKPGNHTEKSEGVSLINIRNLSIRFPIGSGGLFSKRFFHAVKNVNLDIVHKEIFCLIGESGSGKTTLMNGLLGFCPYQEGEIIFDNKPVRHQGDTVHQILKARSQVVFQDPVASLNPYLTLQQSILEPLHAGKHSKKEKEIIARRLAAETGLPEFLLKRKPGKASTGQNQRACIARALSTEPDILFLDEPLSALDAINSKEIAELLVRLKKNHGLTCFLITHNLDLVKEIGTTVAVMYLGRIIEKAPVKDFFSTACHPYSLALLANSRKSGPDKNKRIILEGDIPSPHDPPSGCVFHPRCKKRLPVCEQKEPVKRNISRDHVVFCHLYQPDLQEYS